MPIAIRARLIQEFDESIVGHFVGVDIVAPEQDGVDRFRGAEPIALATLPKQAAFRRHVVGRSAHLEKSTGNQDHGTAGYLDRLSD